MGNEDTTPAASSQVKDALVTMDYPIVVVVVHEG